MPEAPTSIRALQGEQTLELTWDDDLVCRLPYRDVRAECPCASCVNEWTGERVLDPATIPSDIRLEGMEGVGNYAVRLSWSDGHSSGLYTWEALRKLSDRVPPERPGP